MNKLRRNTTARMEIKGNPATVAFTPKQIAEAVEMVPEDAREAVEEFITNNLQSIFDNFPDIESIVPEILHPMLPYILRALELLLEIVQRFM